MSTRLTIATRRNAITAMVNASSLLIDHAVILDQLKMYLHSAYRAAVKKHYPEFCAALEKTPKIVLEQIDTISQVYIGHGETQTLGFMNIPHRLYGVDYTHCGKYFDIEKIRVPLHAQRNELKVAHNYPKSLTDQMRALEKRVDVFLQRVNAALNAYTTVEALLKDFPEWKDYVSTETATAKSNLPAVVPTQVVVDLMQVGFPAPKKKLAVAKKA